MKINKLDLAKTISDFMFLGVEYPEEKAKVLFELKHSLTAHGFEKYIQYYFKRFYKVNIKLNGNTYQFDQGIDLVSYSDCWKIAIVIQCKKYSVKDITELHLTSYIGSLMRQKNKLSKDTKIYYITTSKFTHKAKEYGETMKIKCVDFYDIYKLQKIYNIKSFQEDIIKEEWAHKASKCFETQQLQINYDDNFIITDTPSNKEVFDLLKQVRKDFAYASQLQLWQIAKNETLELLSRKRPHNFKALKEVIKYSDKREQEKIEKYGAVFLERLKYLYKEEEITIEEKTTLFQKIFWITL